MSNFVRRRQQTGAPDRLAPGGGPPTQLDDPAREFIRHQVKPDNDVTLAQLGQQVAEQFQAQVAASTMCRVLATRKLPRKKLPL